MRRDKKALLNAYLYATLHTPTEGGAVRLGADVKIVVLGGGVVGITTAFELQNDGHDVTVIERREGVALETSWGNAGMIAPGHSFAWSSPEAPRILLKSIFSRDQALRLRPSADPRLWKWLLEFLGQCTHQRACLNTLRKHRLAMYSQRVLHSTLALQPLSYNRIASGILYFHRSQKTLHRGATRMRLLAEHGQQVEILARDDVLTLEPALAAAADHIVGGIYAPTDELGDSHKFTCAMASLVQARGGTIRCNTEARSLRDTGDRITHVETSQGDIAADAFVLSLGNESPVLARQLRVRLPIYPIKGYSMTVPIGRHRNPPTIGCVDEDHLIAVSRLGDRMRVTATAEFAGYSRTHRPRDFAHMTRTVRELYPDAGDYEQATYWSGLRPMTPAGTPILGKARHRNLYFNTGHGHIGWTMSHGSARITADLIAGREPAIPLDGLCLT